MSAKQHFLDSIPNLEDCPKGVKKFPGDIAKIGGIEHIWDGVAWLTLKEANERVYNVQLPDQPRKGV